MLDVLRRVVMVEGLNNEVKLRRVHDVTLQSSACLPLHTFYAHDSAIEREG